MSKKRILTGDRPTGKLHLGHYITENYKYHKEMKK